MIRKIVSHFEKVDPVLFEVIEKINDKQVFKLHKYNDYNDYFLSLCREIINQQLTSGAAHAIFGRFSSLFPNQRVTSLQLSEIKDEDLRKAGMSWAKVRALKDLARKVKTKEVRLADLDELDDMAVVGELIKVKGIGVWTAEMFLMFSLGREDVFSYSDLGLRKAIKRLYCFEGEPTKEEAKRISSCWSPYRTYACRILWRSLEF